MSWLIALLLGALFVTGAVVAYRRRGHSDGPRYEGPWWRRAWSFLADALGPEPAVAIPEPAPMPPPEPRRMPPPPPPPPDSPRPHGNGNGSAPPDAPPDGPQPFSGAQADLLHSITSLVNRATHGDIRDVRRCLRTLTVAADCLGAGVSHLGRRLAEPDKHYGAEIWEPCGMAGNQMRSSALHLGQADAMVNSLLRMTLAEGANSSRQIPHHSQLNGPV